MNPFIGSWIWVAFCGVDAWIMKTVGASKLLSCIDKKGWLSSRNWSSYTATELVVALQVHVLSIDLQRISRFVALVPYKKNVFISETWPSARTHEDRFPSWLLTCRNTGNFLLGFCWQHRLRRCVSGAVKNQVCYGNGSLFRPICKHTDHFRCWTH